LPFTMALVISASVGTFLNVTSISVMIDPELQKGRGRERVIVIVLNVRLRAQTLVGIW